MPRVRKITQPVIYATVKIRPETHRSLRILAANSGKSIIDVIHALAENAVALAERAKAGAK